MLLHAVIETPEDEIIDNRLPANLSYMIQHDGSVSAKTAECQLSPFCPISPDKIDVAKVNLKDDDVILFRYPIDTDPADASLMKDILKSEFPNNKVLGITSNVELLIENADDAIAMLEQMIAHIKVMQPIQAQKKIIIE